MKPLKIAGRMLVIFLALVGAYFIVFEWIPMEIAWHRQGCRAYAAATGVDPSHPLPPPSFWQCWGW
jgi:hypothetical protein